LLNSLQRLLQRAAVHLLIVCGCLCGSSQSIALSVGQLHLKQTKTTVILFSHNKWFDNTNNTPATTMTITAATKSTNCTQRDSTYLDKANQQHNQQHKHKRKHRHVPPAARPRASPAAPRTPPAAAASPGPPCAPPPPVRAAWPAGCRSARTQQVWWCGGG
jgi:hypothetical protein